MLKIRAFHSIADDAIRIVLLPHFILGGIASISDSLTCVCRINTTSNIYNKEIGHPLKYLPWSWGQVFQ